MKKQALVLALSMVCLWSSMAQAILIDPYDNVLPSDGSYGLLYGNYYHAGKLTGAGGGKVADLDLTAMVTLLRSSNYFHVGKVPLGFQVILPFGKVEEKKLLHESSSGVGDIVFGPGIFLHTHESDSLKTYLSYWFYTIAPTGEWDRNKTLNLGQHHWYFEHQLSFNAQFRNFVYDMNLNYYHHDEDSDNKLQKPDRFEAEASLGYQFTDKLLVGVNGGGYWDGNASKVDGIPVADSKAKRLQVGPTIGYSITDKLGANLRWTHDVSSANDTKGDDVWLRLSYAF